MSSATKVDLKKQFPELFSASSKKVEFIEVPNRKMFMIDGEGDPNTSQDYQNVMSCLYGASFTLKMDFKKKPKGKDYVVPPLEGLWYMDNMDDWSVEKKNEWKWTMMVQIPDFVPDKEIEIALKKLKEKKPELKDFIEKMRIEVYSEGKSAQLLHIGPYSTEGPNIQKIHDAIKEKGFALSGHHHEIYLGDPRKTAPEKLKTVIRQPYK